jgi:hypothetical protein
MVIHLPLYEVAAWTFDSLRPVDSKKSRALTVEKGKTGKRKDV